MYAEQFRHDFTKVGVYLVDVVFLLTLGWETLIFGGAEILLRIFSDHVRMDEVFHESAYEPLVLVVGDSTALVDVGDKYAKSREWDLLLLVEAVVDLKAAGCQVRHRELLGDVPPYGTEFSSI